MNYEDFLELAKKRRSIRRFKSDPIPDEYIGKIIEAARWAPSGGNSQPWEFIVIKKRSQK
jgi:nitroreductase